MVASGQFFPISQQQEQIYSTCLNMNQTDNKIEVQNIMQNIHSRKIKT